MNYYERHLGDYARNAGHLSMLEHGAYTLLLDRYYTTDAPIPESQAYRLCRARTDEEMAAVDAVLAEFFVLSDGLWHNNRADEEIEKARARIEAAKANGKKGGRPTKPNANPEVTEQEPSGLLLGTPDETQTKAHQAPSIHLPKEDQKPSSSGDDRPAKLQERVAQITDDAITAWNASALVAGGLPAVRSAVGREKRQAQVRRMLRTARAMCLDLFGSPTVTPQFWVGLWAEYAKDDFFAGRLAGGKGHENWKPDFEFLTREESVLKLYDRRATA